MRAGIRHRLSGATGFKEGRGGVGPASSRPRLYFCKTVAGKAAGRGSPLPIIIMLSHTR